MEDWQREIIKTNLSSLVELTKWNTEISATLTSKNILSSNDVDLLDTLNRSEGEMARIKLLYSFLETRTAGFEGIASTLHKAKQTGAFNILLKECVSYLAEQRTFLLPSPPTSFWMLSRNLVSLKIFDHCVADLLVFKGIGYDELCSFTKCGQLVSPSGDLDASDYVLLQGEIVLKEICQKAGKRNVHLLEYKRDLGGFLLVESFGHVFNICQYLQTGESEPISIDNYFSTITTDPQVRLIEGDFQMWNNFWDKLEKKNEESAFGFFGWNRSKIEKVDLAHKVSVIGKTSKELVQDLLNCSDHRLQDFFYSRQSKECHLILGILGRVEDERLKLLREIILKVCSEIGKLRVWILVHAEVWRLERVFRVKAWRMKGPENCPKLLSGANVISPTVEWELNWFCPILPSENPYFSSPPFVDLLEASNVDQGMNVAEICGEVFTKCVNTLTQWLGAAASSDIQLELMKIGLRSLFPGNVGLIQGGGMHSGEQISFVCEDIAAFAVSKLLADDSYSNHIETLKFEEFVTNEVFQLDGKWRFKNYHVCYFLDHFLVPESGRESRILKIIHKILDGSEYSTLFVYRCIRGRFVNLLKLLAGEPDKGSQMSYLKDDYMMKLAVSFGDVPILNYVGQVNSCNLDLLKFAMQRGDISIVTNLLERKSYNFEMKDYTILLNACVENSCLDTENIVHQKKKVFDKLLEEMRSTYKGSFDFSYRRIHVQLFKHLISAGVLDIENSRTIIIQNVLSQFTRGELHELVLDLASIKKQNVFQNY